MWGVLRSQIISQLFYQKFDVVNCEWLTIIYTHELTIFFFTNHIHQVMVVAKSCEKFCDLNFFFFDKLLFLFMLVATLDKYELFYSVDHQNKNSFNNNIF